MRKTFFEKCINLHLCRVALVLLLLVPAISSLQAIPSQSKTISGVVTSATDNEPLIGVSVQVKETSTGGITDMDGKYSVTAQTGQTLVFSYIGYKSQEFKVGDSSVINVSLKEDTEMLDEVVVVGYGVQKKKLVTGATVQVKGENIAKLNTTNPLSALQGQTPGVNIVSTSGQPGASMSVTIRGLGTVGNSQPLYLIDGVGGDISTLNPADIESIDVLKDAASAAIYGAQAANGVVLVTTKSGKEGTCRISYDGFAGWQTIGRKYSMLNASEYMSIMDEARLNSGMSPVDWASLSSIHDARGNIYDTDWIDQAIEDGGLTTSHNLSFTGGSKTSTYAISGGYTGQDGLIGGSDVSYYKRYNFRVNSEHKMWNGLVTVGEHVGFVWKDTRGMGTGNIWNNNLRSAFSASPIIPVYDADGNYNSTVNSDWNVNDGNPYGNMMVNRYNNSKNGSLDANVYVQIEPIKNLRFKTVYGISYGASEYRAYTPKYQFTPQTANTVSKVNQSHGHGLSMVWTNTLSYDFNIATEHHVNALIGSELSTYDGSNTEGSNTGLIPGFDDWDHAYLVNTNGTENKTVKGSPYDSTRGMSYFARLGWTWKERYMVNATMRADGSSKFAKGNRWGYFPSGSLAWAFGRENFVKDNLTWLSNGKLRVSYGLTGNNRIGDYDYMARLYASENTYKYPWDSTFYPGYYVSSIANPNLKWETTEQYDFGLDLGFLDGRLNLNIDYYIKTTKDLLMNADTPASSGYATTRLNIGELRNTGFEVTLESTNIQNKNFTWSSSFNIAFNKNKILSLNYGQEQMTSYISWDQKFRNQIAYVSRVGESAGKMYGFVYDGTYKEEDFNITVNENGKKTYELKPGVPKFKDGCQPGDPKYKNIDGSEDNLITDNDRTVIGNGHPLHTGGFTNNFVYKNWDLNIFLQWSYGNDVFNVNRLVMENPGAKKQLNQFASYKNRWSESNPTSNIPRVRAVGADEYSSLYVEDGSFLKLKTISLGYNFDTKTLKRIGLSAARVFVSAENIATITGYSGSDPEVSTRHSVLTPGFDWSAYPRAFNASLGVNVTF